MKTNSYLAGAFTAFICAEALSACGKDAGTGAEGDEAGVLTVEPYPPDPTAVAFKWTGVIAAPMAKELGAAFAANKDKYTRIVIDFHSPGGSVSEGEAAINTIREMKRTHSVWTYVGPESDCLSMCVPVYMEGKLRIAASTSVWMFHEPVAMDTLSGKETFIYEFEKRQVSLEVYNRFFKRSKIDKDWLDRLSKQWRGQDVWKTGQELKDEGSNIVTVIE